MISIRYHAVKALTKIFCSRVKPKESIEELSSGIDKRDRAFLMELVYGVLRYRDYLDWIAKKFLKEPYKLPLSTLNNLRISLYQIKYLLIPEWAVVNEAVNTEKLLKGRPSLVNAVLRNYLRHKDEITIPQKTDRINYISIVTSHPRWLIKKWIQRFGYEETLLLAEKNNEIPPFSIRIYTDEEKEKALNILAENKINARLSRYSPSGIIVENLRTFHVLEELLKDIKYFVQDEAAQLITYLLNPLPNERILDACAAPGGKTTHIAQMMKDHGEIIAVESELKRIKQLEENILKFGIKSIKVVHSDVKTLRSNEYCTPNCLFDRILLDAPCSSIGVIRRNPDVKYRHTQKDLKDFKKKQKDLLKAVSYLLKNGGTMVYSVCSTEPEEGEDVIKEFLQDNPDFSIIKGDYDFFSAFEININGYPFYRTFPHKHNMDGFFAVRLKREF